jgi:aminopeptidase
MRRAKGVEISSTNGTKLHLELRGDRNPNCDFDATQHLKGRGGNLPMGEVFISPRIDSAEGIFVIDGSFNTQFPWATEAIRDPVALTFRKGQLASVEGGQEARLFLDNVREAEKRTKLLVRKGSITPALGERYLFATRAIGEFAIGVNEKAQIIGDILIDEKRLGDAHIAVGRSYDGDPSLIHMDAIIRKPKVVFQYSRGHAETILERGRLNVE